MIAVWILSYLAVYMLGMASLVAYFSLLDYLEKRKLRAMPPPKPEDGLNADIIKPHINDPHPAT